MFSATYCSLYIPHHLSASAVTFKSHALVGICDQEIMKSSFKEEYLCVVAVQEVKKDFIDVWSLLTL